MPKNFYPLLIGLLLGSFLIFCGWSAYRAATHGSRISDPEYYSKGLKYNSTLVEKQVARTLGWQLKSELHSRLLQVRLTNAQGVPVSGASGKLVFYEAGVNNNIALPLVETAPGTYQAALPLDLKGEIAAHLDFEHDGAQINRQLLLNL